MKVRSCNQGKTSLALFLKLKNTLWLQFAEELAVSEGDEFAVINAADNSVAYTGKLTLVTEYEPLDSGEKILKADFSDLTVPANTTLVLKVLTIHPSLKSVKVFTVHWLLTLQDISIISVRV